MSDDESRDERSALTKSSRRGTPSDERGDEDKSFWISCVLVFGAMCLGLFAYAVFAFDLALAAFAAVGATLAYGASCMLAMGL